VDYGRRGKAWAPDCDLVRTRRAVTKFALLIATLTSVRLPLYVRLSEFRGPLGGIAFMVGGRPRMTKGSKGQGRGDKNVP
jgi:hypothetical protein